jgi:hypothetical protein
MPENWKLSPSDLTFLWDECKRCFYLKVRHNFKRPAAPFPKIFGTIDQLMKETYRDEPAMRLSPDLPEGKIIMTGHWVTSASYPPESHSNTCYILGIFDTLVQFEDHTYGIIDFKTTKPSPGQVPFYSRQLHAYAYALENSAPGKLHFQPVERLGLFCFDPSTMHEDPLNTLNLCGPATWVECPLDKEGFKKFLDEVLNLLESPELPEASPECSYCAYRESARSTNY